MKAFIKENRLLLILILITVIAATVTIAARINVERENKTYDVVLDYNEIAAMAEQSDHDVSWWLSQFKKMGINKVGLTEESIITLMEDTELTCVSASVVDVLHDSVELLINVFMSVNSVT